MISLHLDIILDILLHLGIIKFVDETPRYIAIYSFHSRIRSIKRRFLANPTPVWRRWRFPCARSREAAAVEEELGVEATVKEIGLSGVDSSGGDWQSRERRGHY
jgi:hypothetical protein